MAVGIQCSMGELLKYDPEDFVQELRDFLTSEGFAVEAAQKEAWRDCCLFLKEQFGEIKPEFQGITLLFEYMLPLEKGRRPDVILLMKGKVIILEFKMKEKALYKDMEQAIGYREDIKHFHAYTAQQGLQVESFLVLTKAQSIEQDATRPLTLLTKANFLEKIAPLLRAPMTLEESQCWVDSEYQPVPDIMEATQTLFFKGDLPYIKSIAEGDIAEAIYQVKVLIKDNEKALKKRIIFLSGVPGAGKTLVGLKTVYDYNHDTYKNRQQPMAAIYLSGNGPLVNVLQHQLSTGVVNGLEGKAFVKGMLHYKKEYLDHDAIPQQTFLVFDEAQRTWDQAKMRRPYSEAEAVLSIADKIYAAHHQVTLLCLIGEGQAIHTGEEKGMPLWIEALQKDRDWEIYFPPHLQSTFAPLTGTQVLPALHLDTSIRTGFIDISQWIEAVLQGHLESARQELDHLKTLGFKIRLTRNFSRLEKTMPKLKNTYSHCKYGLLISSKADLYKQNIKRYTHNHYVTSFVKDSDAGKWFLEDCEKLQIAASEFLCQGLEIDFPMVLFGGDYLIRNGNWQIDERVRAKNAQKYEDFDTIMQNIYRVLLSRGKQGMILFIPEDQGFEETYQFFDQMGIPAF